MDQHGEDGSCGPPGSSSSSSWISGRAASLCNSWTGGRATMSCSSYSKNNRLIGVRQHRSATTAAAAVMLVGGRHPHAAAAAALFRGERHSCAAAAGGLGRVRYRYAAAATPTNILGGWVHPFPGATAEPMSLHLFRTMESASARRSTLMKRRPRQAEVSEGLRGLPMGVTSRTCTCSSAGGRGSL